ncbi:hypothetical protein C8R46DRAFT_1120831, partial [Mycena filopes]
MRFVASGPRQSPPRPTSAAPRPSAQLSNPSPSSQPRPRPQHPHARSSTRDCVTSDSRRSLESRVGHQQWASATRTASPRRSRTRRIWPPCRYNRNALPFFSFRLRLSRARRSAPNAPIWFFLSLCLSGSVVLWVSFVYPYYTCCTPPQIPIFHKYLSSTIPTSRTDHPGAQHIPHYHDLLLYMVWYLNTDVQRSASVFVFVFRCTESFCFLFCS